MAVQMIGVDHERAPVELREALAFDRQEISRFLPALLKRTKLTEAALLSTCNRTELYAHPADVPGGIDPASEIMAFKGIEPDPSLWKRRNNEEAVEHLFCVAAGMRSMVKGEAQILGQVKDAFRCAVEALTTGPILNRLFHAAFRAGKRVRAETGISEGAVSVSQAAVEMASRDLGETFPHAKVVLLGAGQMAELIARHLASKGVASVCIANRTLCRAQELAATFGFTARALEAYATPARDADLLFSACSADGFLVTPDNLGKPDRDLLVIDIGIPRTVDPEINGLPGCTLKNIDALNGLVDVNRRRREEEAEKGRSLVLEEVEDAMKWIATRKNASLIQSLAGYMESIREREIKRVCKNTRLSEVEKLERLSSHIIKKITQPLIKKINEARAEGDQSTLEAYLDLLKEVYRI